MFIQPRMSIPPMVIMHYILKMSKKQNCFIPNCLSDTETKMFKAESDLDKKWESIYKELKGLSDTDRHMMSLAELAEQTNSGIRILKSEPSSSNSFGLYYTQTIDDKIIPYNCK